MVPDGPEWSRVVLNGPAGLEATRLDGEALAKTQKAANPQGWRFIRAFARRSYVGYVGGEPRQGEKTHTESQQSQ